MDYAIINAENRHLDALLAMERLCFSVPWTRAQLAAELPDEHHEFLVAESGDRILGYVGMMSVLDEGYISNVAVAPDCRRQGIAKALISALLQRAEQRELSFVTLEVRASNAPAIALYESFGFAPVGRRKGYYEAPKEDAVLMTRFLK
jgi:ribosomal-protein-alanine N-acetyltransferase